MANSKRLQLSIDGKVIGTATVVPCPTQEHWEYYERNGSIHCFRNIHTGEKRYTQKELEPMQYGTLVTLEFIEK